MRELAHHHGLVLRHVADTPSLALSSPAPDVAVAEIVKGERVALAGRHCHDLALQFGGGCRRRVEDGLSGILRKGIS